MMMMMMMLDVFSQNSENIMSSATSTKHTLNVNGCNRVHINVSNEK